MGGKMNWNGSAGGAMGGNGVLMIGEDYVGHFYTDASEGIDADQVLSDIAHRYNVYEDLLDALKELVEHFDDDVMGHKRKDQAEIVIAQAEGRFKA
ncbi:hypothetical protein N8A98_06655 [Devosia neptuniae]|uniref:Uncharacterized protein n=1 Tax=Devosia neptuniae TaxID=191302 RepID=A0ABY6CF43_9HYPH|nr:hypothetical protein [Devosia neptuniae]UXN70861.1 hypothetical protein N8A98_06655 [Devosia neptuniae]